jgi:anti-sigma-K factor RskA
MSGDMSGMNGHPTREEDFDLYALGALEGEEKRAIESHLAGCVSCAQKLAEAQGRIALLAFASPPAAPSAAVKQRLLSQVHADARRSTAPARSAERSTPSGTLGNWRNWWNIVLIPAAAALAVATIFLWNENRQLGRDLNALHAIVNQEQQQLGEARKIADLLSSRDTITIPLAQQPGMPVGSAHVSYNPKTGMLMYYGALAPAPANKSYQLWLVPLNGKPISAGVFNPAVGLADHWIVAMPAGTMPKAFAVSLEPNGGMPQPTGPMVLVSLAS